ncbi:helix-turn-helix transcriptional regulator [Burkholderia pyrrocinia]|uniref:helix-turn-helix transcriptional regulator n=1 Tax=Burkholderia pyrrocinia TaxID=60550 RepID=UPI00158D33FE|nr:AlpA family phage regulatory protein [Burkholderia pyrrocinia]
MSAKNALVTQAPATLPLDGFSKWADLRPFIRLSRETVRKLEREGRFPRAIRLTLRCTVFDNRETHRYLADPLNYRAADAANDVTEGA